MLSSIFRKSFIQNQAHHMLAVRAPKKKKGAEPAPPTIKDIVNIFKDRTDPVVYPSDMYPPWLM